MVVMYFNAFLKCFVASYFVFANYLFDQIRFLTAISQYIISSTLGSKLRKRNPNMLSFKSKIPGASLV